ncbi:MAG: 3-deoxy-D-manno-octulosonic acid transferase [Pararhodobacter sp.]|nr:3-deoxy-D-manno-octulosonic acid transferase [Pararhodobacter sp.]
MPLFLRFYLGFARISAPLWWLALAIRRRKGREDPVRASEKLGRYTIPRPGGVVLWFHAVSVGESQALVTLLQRLTAAHADVSVVLTTLTLASAQALEARGLPERVIHQFSPADYPGAMRRFLSHWRPDALIVAEADLWPEMLMQARRAGLPMALINTHVTERRYRRRRKIVRSNGYLMNLFDPILVQDARSMERYVDLGADPARMSVMGVLKAASDPLPDRPEARAALSAAIGGRPVWLAASTKVIEEPQLFEAHARALEALPDLLFLIAPRQRTEADRTEAAARAHFAADQIARRSRDEPITPQTRVYLADTIGEMGLWYRLAPVAYTGNSLPVPGIPLTGKNPFEAVALGVMVVHGPDVGNFAHAYARLKAAKGALEVATPAEMARAVVAAQDPAFRAPYLAGAAQVQAENLHPLQVALAAMETILADIRQEPAARPATREMQVFSPDIPR